MKTGKRHIKNGSQFNHLFPIPKGENVIVKKVAHLDDTIHLMKEVVSTTLEDTFSIAQMLEASTEYDTCQNIWNFCFTHLQYTKDEMGKEQVRRPSRTWKDRIAGIDCDCMSVFIGSILTNLKIPFSFRLTKYRSHDFEHVYPIAHTNNGIIILDTVVHKFNREVPYSAKKDINMELQYLNGFEEDDFDEFEELDEFLENDYPMDVQSMIVDEAQDLEGLRSFFKKAKKKVKSVAKKVSINNIKKGLKKGLHAINRVNPATALLRAGVLASMKLNLMKIASKIRFAYWSDAEALKNNMDMNKFNQLKRIREKVEKIYFGAGGKTENLKKAILSGKGNRDRRVVLNGLGEIITPVFDEDELRTILGDELFDDEFSEVENGINGLGVVATGTAIASATGVLATIASLIKKLGSLFKQGSPQAQQEVIQDNTDNQEEQTRKFSVQNLISSFSNKQATPTPIIQTRSASTPTPIPLVVNPQPQFVDTTNTSVVEDSTEPKPEKKGLMAWVKKNPVASGGIALAVVGGGYLLYKKSQRKKKSLSGIDGTLGAPKRKKKKRRSPTKKLTTKTRRKSPVARASKMKKIELL
ncbi:MAG: hypothetical protein N4A35_17685 [Flavobacteriales bacterium]|jgi:vacuolar-type H+-ATPase subunit E/Vma4|nr:hypothetical protein [Flavobacteriales bacterium]